MERKLTCGDFNTLEDRLVEEVRDAKSSDILAPVIVLVGSQVLATHLDLLLAERLPQKGQVNVRIMTLRSFCRRLIYGEGPMPAVPRTLAEWMLRRLAGSLSRDNRFRITAEMPGFAPLLLSTFEDLDEAGFDEVPMPPDDRKFKELLDLYDRYRGALKGRFSRHSDVLREAIPNAGIAPALFGTDRVIVYGLYDLTGLQRRLLAALAEVFDVLVMFPHEPREAYRYAESTMAWLESSGFERCERAPVRLDEASDLGRLRAGWANALEGERAPACDGSVRIVSAPGEAREVEELAREIVAAAGEGVPFDEMAVILRNGGTYMPLIREEFDRVGIPYYSAFDRTLLDTPEGRKIMMLLDLAGTDLPRTDVIDFLSFVELDVEGVLGRPGVARQDRWRHISAEANVVAGLAQWETRLRDYVAAANEHALECGREPDGRLSDDVDELLLMLSKLEEGLSTIPAEGELPEMTEPLLSLFQKFVKETPSSADIRARVIEAVAGLTAAPVRERVKREEFSLMLAGHLQSKQLQRGSFRRGADTGSAVNVLELMDARGTGFRLVLLPGLVEKSFPAPVREDAALLDDERDSINQAGTGDGFLPLKKERVLEDRLLFQIAVSAARERLIITFPRLDPSSGRPRIPSFYLLQVAGALTGRRNNYEELEKLPAPLFRRALLMRGSGLEAERALDAHEFRLAFMQPERSPRAAAMRAYVGGEPRVARAKKLFASHGSRGFDRFDGLVGGLGETFLSGRKSLSVSALESFTRCPYLFFNSEVLGVRKERVPEEALVITPQDLGLIFHSVMADFTERYRALPPGERQARAGAVLDDAARACFEEFERTGKAGAPASWARNKEKIFLATGRAMNEMLGLEGYENVSAEEYFTVMVPDEEGAPVLCISGKMDRADIDRSEMRLVVTDYKTGKMKNKINKKGEGNPFETKPNEGRWLNLQGVSYVFGTCELIGLDVGDLSGWSGVLYHPFEGEGERVEYGGASADLHMAWFLDILRQVRVSIEQGAFLRMPGRWCGYCDFVDACPGQRAYLDRRKGEAAEFEGLSRLYNGEIFVGGD
jgi:ATP-dependent helicase/DNAse subunit B